MKTSETALAKQLGRTRPDARARWRTVGLWGLIALLSALWLGTLHSPEPNWDEGWTLLVARTWVEQGHYGKLLLGEPVGPGMAASFVTVAPIALAFQLLGFGFWQGRMAIALLNLASLAALALLARRLYGPRVGAAVVPILLLTTMHATGNPLYLGRMAMGEPAQMLLLALAFTALIPALAGSWPWAGATMLLGGIALLAKAQTMPFWSVALLAPLPILLWQRRWRWAGTLVAVYAGSLLARRGLGELWARAIAEHTAASPALPDLSRTVATVFTPTSRQLALEFSLVIALPALIGMAWAAWGLLRGLGRGRWDDPRTVVQASLLALAASWYAWYLLLSVGWTRYLYPVVFFGAVFATAMLAEWSGGFRPREVVARIRAGGAAGRAAIVALALLACCVPATIFHLAYTYPLTSDRALLATIGWLHANTPADVVIETNESELFVYLERPYHYPPDPVHVRANERLLLGEEADFGYDPLTADPDYLVGGRMERWWQLYQPSIEAGEFQPVEQFGIYTVYRRVRPEAGS